MEDQVCTRSFGFSLNPWFETQVLRFLSFNALSQHYFYLFTAAFLQLPDAFTSLCGHFDS